jgi:hypothetical protein
MHSVFAAVHLGIHDLSPVQIQDQMQVKSPAHHLGRQVAHVPELDATWVSDCTDVVKIYIFDFASVSMNQMY